MFEEFVPRLKIGMLKPLSVVDNSAYEFYRIAPPGVMLVMIPVGLGKFSKDDVERVFAPIDGTVVRMAEVGPGQTVRPGDTLIRISPTSADKAAELVADGLDAPLLNVGRKVRLLFYGIPAIPLPAWPELMAGTYGGVIKVVDQVDNGKGNFRFWVVPDPEERPWPEQSHVRQGSKIMGWVILNRVPLWYELWRRFNLFPPDYQEGPPSLLDTLLPKAGRGAK